MKVPATAAVVGLGMWVGLAAAVHAAAVMKHRVLAERPNLATQPSTIEHANVPVLSLIAPKSTAIPIAPTAGAAAIAIDAPVKRAILVSLQDRKLALLVNGEVTAIYPVAIGKASTPSPTGDFTIVSRVVNPTYSHKGRIARPGPGNPVGTRWMGLSDRGYGIHGTNVPSSIGKAASHGCIRMGRKDLEQLFTQIRPGDAVEIRGERDAEVVAIFGAAPQQQQSIVVAQAASPSPRGGE